MVEEQSPRERALALVEQGVQCQARGEFENAVALFTRSLAVYPTAEAYTYRGWAYQALGRVDDAIAECRKAIAVDPDFGNPYNDIGAYLIARGQLDDAIEWLEKAKRAPRYEPRHFPHMNLGRVYAAKGMVLQAIAEFEAALRICPGEPNCLAMAARLRAMLN